MRVTWLSLLLLTLVREGRPLYVRAWSRSRRVPEEASARPSFDPSTPTNVTAALGKAAYLTCRIRNIGNSTVSWIRHRDLAILSAGQHTYAQDGRVATYHQPGSDEWVLRIKFLQQRDAGTYGCQLPTSPPLSREIQLRVVVPETRILGETEIYVDIGSTLNLTCAVSYSPEPTEFIFWYRNETAVNYSTPPGRVTVVSERATTTNSYLMIRNARVEDSGIYTCSPSNAAVATVKVHVLKGEKPAAMQTNSAGPLSASLALLVAMVTARWLI